MFELIMAIAICVVIGKIAAADNKSGIIWGCITAGLCIPCAVIPLPFLRFLIAGILAFVLMIVVQFIKDR